MMNRKKELAAPREPVRFGKMMSRTSGRFLTFVIGSAILVAAFAISGVWMSRENSEWSFRSLFGFERHDEQPGDATDANGDRQDAPQTVREPDEGQPAEPPADSGNIPEGAIAVISRDLSCLAEGENYIYNETVYRPDVAAMRNPVSGEPQAFDASDGPVVLILHTHATEAYLPDGAAWLNGEIGNVIYSTDPAISVLAVGEALCRELNANGVPAIQCRDLHGEEGTLRNSYQHAAECIQQYLTRYPTIRYVIDLHRDGILTSDGSCVRTLAGHSSEPTAQVMTVVGSDGNGTPCPSWHSNLALALQLRDRLNRNGTALCRPVSLRNASYNQEFAPTSLLLEIGSAGNSVQEAIRAAKAVATELSALILGV